MSTAKLNCSPGNYQCGGRCLPSSNKCYADIGGDVAKQFTDFANLVKKQTGKFAKEELLYQSAGRVVEHLTEGAVDAEGLAELSTAAVDSIKERDLSPIGKAAAGVALNTAMGKIGIKGPVREIAAEALMGAAEAITDEAKPIGEKLKSLQSIATATGQEMRRKAFDGTLEKLQNQFLQLGVGAEMSHLLHVGNATVGLGHSSFHAGPEAIVIGLTASVVANIGGKALTKLRTTGKMFSEQGEELSFEQMLDQLGQMQRLSSPIETVYCDQMRNRLKLGLANGEVVQLSMA